MRPLLTLLFVLSLAPTAALAQNHDDTEAADRAFNEALALMDVGRYLEACPKLEASQRLAPASGTLLNLADCYEHLGRVGSAWKAFEEAAARAKASGKRERERVARERAALLVPRLSRLVIIAPVAAPNGLSITLDGAPLPAATWSTPLVVDPGSHELEAHAPGRQAFSTQLLPISSGETRNFQLPNLADADSSAAAVGSRGSSRMDGQRIAAVISAGVGVVGIAAGSAFGLHSMAKHRESDRHCDGNACADAQGVNAMSDARVAGDRATAGFIVGGLGLAAASVLWFVRPFGSSPLVEAQLGVGTSGVALRGRF